MGRIRSHLSAEKSCDTCNFLQWKSMEKNKRKKNKKTNSMRMDAREWINNGRTDGRTKWKMRFREMYYSVFSVSHSKTPSNTKAHSKEWVQQKETSSFNALSDLCLPDKYDVHWTLYYKMCILYDAPTINYVLYMYMLNANFGQNVHKMVIETVFYCITEYFLFKLFFFSLFVNKNKSNDKIYRLNRLMHICTDCRRIGVLFGAETIFEIFDSDKHDKRIVKNI